ncbi:MAG: hypothetical protein Q8M51_15070 [Polaromonas sp.]|nr:hypothetical protein [Polaromonas sp.]
MNEFLCIEWVEFQLKPGVTESQLLDASEALRTEFLSLQHGFQRRSLIRLGEQGLYADLVHWTNRKDADAAMAASIVIPACGAYFALFEVVKAPAFGEAIASHDAAQRLPPIDSAEIEVGGMEISFFKPKPNVSDHSLSRAAQKMAAGLYCAQPGFISHFVVKSEAGIYADVVLAASSKRAAELCASWGSDPYAEPCQGYLDMIRPETMQIAFFDVLK